MKSQTFLRRTEREDLDTIVSWMQDSDYLYFLYGDPAQSPKRIRENIVSMLGRSQANLLPSSIHLVIDHKTKGPIGLISLQKISWRNRACVVDFYMGNQGLRGRLESGAAMYRMAEYCFDELNLHRISAYIYSFNTPSWRLLERCGAVRELTLKEHVVRDGDLCDMYCYGLLRRDFQSFRESETQFATMSLEKMIDSLNIEAPDAGTPT
jgi:RimJ/RimL family protein N-acetyltransferase